MSGFWDETVSEGHTLTYSFSEIPILVTNSRSPKFLAPLAVALFALPVLAVERDFQLLGWARRIVAYLGCSLLSLTIVMSGIAKPIPVSSKTPF